LLYCRKLSSNHIDHALRRFWTIRVFKLDDFGDDCEDKKMTPWDRGNKRERVAVISPQGIGLSEFQE